MFANVSGGQVGGPSSRRNAKRRNPAPDPSGSVKAMLCNVTGSSSGSDLGGKSVKASLAPSTINNLYNYVYDIKRKCTSLLFPSWYSIAAFKLNAWAKPDCAKAGGFPTLLAPPSVSACAPTPSSGWLRIPRSTISAKEIKSNLF